MRERFKRRLKPLLDFKGSAHQLALAFGLGIILGVIPGTGAIAAATCAAILRLNLPLMVAGALLTNPVTVPFVYLGSYLLGEWLLGKWLPAGFLARLAVGTLLGNLILAVGFGFLGYLLALGFIARIRAQRARHPTLM